jgi:RNA polymerase sigma-70 factor (ECF subfamily)
MRGPFHPGGEQDAHPVALVDPLLALLEGAEAGDPTACNQLLLALAPHLLAVARRTLGGDHPDVLDVAQEAAWGVLQALPRFRRESSLVHFACRVSLLTAMNVRRAEAARQRKLRSLLQFRQVVDGPEGDILADPHQALSQRRCVAAVRELLGRLPQAQAEVLGLHHVVGMTTAEIALATDTPKETVRSRLKRARQELRRLVLRDEELAEELGARHGHA